MRALLALALALLVFASAASAANYSRVLFANNTNSSESASVLAYFFASRNITSPNVVNLSTYNNSFNITVSDFNSTILQPVKSRLQALNASNITIDYIVLTRGFPYVVQDNFILCEQNTSTRAASIDSELALVNGAYEQYVNGTGATTNPSYGYSGTFSKARFGIYLITRLDAFNLTDIYAMIDRSGNATNISSGNFVFDRSTASSILNTRMQTANASILAAGMSSIIDNAPSQALGNLSNVSFYVSWGSPYNPTNRGAPNNTWANGAIADYFFSWSSLNMSGTSNPCNSGGSLVGDLVSEGASMALGFVREPYAPSAIHTDTVIDRLLSGTLPAASIYYSMNYLSWQNVIFGDPLMEYMPQRLLANMSASTPNNSAVHSCTGNLTFSQSSNFNISYVAYSINGGSNSTSQGATLSIPISSLSEGNNTITLWPVDYDGRASLPIIFNYARNYSSSAPAPQLSSPSAGQSFNAENSTSINISWAYPPAAGGEAYSVFFSNDSGAIWQPIASTASLYYAWGVSSLPNLSTYKVMVRLSSPNSSCGNESSAFTIDHYSTPAMSSSRLLPSSYSPATDTLVGYCNATDWDYSNGYSNFTPIYRWRLFKDSSLNLSGTSGLGFTEIAAGSTTDSYLEGSGASARFSYPHGLAAGSDGFLYIADTYNSRIRKINTTTNQTYLVAGNGTDSYAEGAGNASAFDGPTSLAFGSDGFLYVADSGNCIIRKINTTANQTYLVAGNQTDCYDNGGGYQEGQGGSALFSTSVSGIAFGSDGFLYVSDTGNYVIRKINTTANQTYFVAGNTSNDNYQEGQGQSAWIGNPMGLAFGSDGFLYFADESNGRIRKINTTTNQTYFVAGNGTDSYGDGIGNASAFDDPTSLAFGSDGFLYVGEEFIVRRVNTTTNRTYYVSGSTSSEAGDAAGHPMSARFNVIYGLAQGEGNRFHLASNNRIYSFLTGESYSWGAEGSAVSLASPNISTNQSWVLECAATDGTTNSSPLNSSAASNTTAPGISSVSISRVPNDISQTPASLGGYCTASDYENATITYYYSWYLGGVLQSSGTATGASGAQALLSTYSPVSIGQSWMLACTASDGTYNSSQATASYVVAYSFSSTGGGSLDVPRGEAPLQPALPASGQEAPPQPEVLSSKSQMLLVLPDAAQAGTTIQIRVETQEGEPVWNATVELTAPGGQKLSLTSGKDGAISFFAAEPGTYHLLLEGKPYGLEVMPAPQPPLGKQISDAIAKLPGSISNPGNTPAITYSLALIAAVLALVAGVAAYFLIFRKR